VVELHLGTVRSKLLSAATHWHGSEPEFVFVLAMWSAMTAVMMTPVAWPWLRALQRSGPDQAAGHTVPMFALGYSAAWAGFSAVMSGGQLLLMRSGITTPITASAPALAGAALMLAGAFQFTDLKNACLAHCRSPFGYFAAHWRPGARGAVSMGARHGIFCLGCCWAIMALALVVGMMDLRMMAVLMGVMVLETLTPSGAWLSRPIGVVLLLWGLALFLG